MMLVLVCKLGEFSLCFGTMICCGSIDVWQQALLGRDENCYRGNPTESCVLGIINGHPMVWRRLTETMLLYSDICSVCLNSRDISLFSAMQFQFRNSALRQFGPKVAFGSFILLCPFRGKKKLFSAGETVRTVRVGQRVPLP